MNTDRSALDGEYESSSEAEIFCADRSPKNQICDMAGQHGVLVEGGVPYGNGAEQLDNIRTAGLCSTIGTKWPAHGLQPYPRWAGDSDGFGLRFRRLLKGLSVVGLGGFRPGAHWAAHDTLQDGPTTDKHTSGSCRGHDAVVVGAGWESEAVICARRWDISAQRRRRRRSAGRWTAAGLRAWDSDADAEADCRAGDAAARLPQAAADAVAVAVARNRTGALSRASSMTPSRPRPWPKMASCASPPLETANDSDYGSDLDSELVIQALSQLETAPVASLALESIDDDAPRAAAVRLPAQPSPSLVRAAPARSSPVVQAGYSQTPGNGENNLELPGQN